MERFDADAVVLAVGVKAAQQCAAPPTFRPYPSRPGRQARKAHRRPGSLRVTTCCRAHLPLPGVVSRQPKAWSLSDVKALQACYMPVEPHVRPCA